MDQLIEQLHGGTKSERLSALLELKKKIDSGELKPIPPQRDVNNHIHTTYSFSPYSPAEAVYRSYMAGLKTAGIVDHDSVAGVSEFLEAAKILGMPVSCGFEVRCDLTDSELGTFKLNNPEQAGVAYVTVQGLPHNRLEEMNEILAPYRQARLERTKQMADGIANLLKPYGIEYDFERDVLPLTQFNQGGTITERYLLFALAKILMDRLGKGEKLISYLTDELKITVSDKAKAALLNESNPHYIYDLLGLFKAEFLDKVYVKGGADCPPLAVIRKLCDDTGAILTYCYLGDQISSVTGDKKAAKYEDDNLEFILGTFKKMGFNGCAYMPSRNTDEQIQNVKKVCATYDLFEICGEDLNQPSQPFICEKMRGELYADAYDNTFALIAHEERITKGGKEAGLFGDVSKPLNEKVAEFAAYGKTLCE